MTTTRTATEVQRNAGHPPTQNSDGDVTYYSTGWNSEGILYWRENWWSEECWGWLTSPSEFTVRDCSPATRRRRIVAFLTSEGFQVTPGQVPALKDHPEATSSITDEAFLAALGSYPADGEHPMTIWSLAHSFPELPWESVLAKARNLILRGVIEGCGCGCRGDFRLTEWLPAVPEPVTEAEIAAAATARAEQIAEQVAAYTKQELFEEFHRMCGTDCDCKDTDACVGDCGLACGECGDQDHIDRLNGDVDENGVPANQTRYALLPTGGPEQF